jgi:hypothetical protein
VPVQSGAGSIGAAGADPACTVTLSAPYKSEGIRPGWPPRSRTELYLRIRQAPSTGWVAASGRWKCRSPGDSPARVFKTRCRAGGAPSFEESGGLEPQRANADPSSKRSPRLAGSLSMSALPPDANGREMAEDGAVEAHDVPAAARFPAGASRLAGSSSEESG